MTKGGTSSLDTLHPANEALGLELVVDFRSGHRPDKRQPTPDHHSRVITIISPSALYRHFPGALWPLVRVGAPRWRVRFG